jgi:hypothetical protein
MVPLLALLFITRTSLGVALLPFLDLADVDFAGVGGIAHAFNYHAHPFLYTRQSASHLVFLVVALLVLSRKSNTRILSTSKTSISPGPAFLVGGLLLLLSFILYYRYFVLGPGLQLLVQTRFVFQSVTDAITHRSELRDSVALGEGMYGASIAAYVFLPAAALFAVQSRLRIQPGIVASCFFLSLCYTAHLRQKAPPIETLIVYGGILVLSSRRLYGGFRFLTFLRLGLLLVICGLVLAAAAYHFNQGLPWMEAFQSVIVRVLVIPGTTESNFFYVFPEFREYRGILESFYMPSRLVAEARGDISIQEVTFVATGDTYSGNCSFLAYAWSGAGYNGVALVTSTTLLAFRLLDQLLLNKCGLQTTLATAAASFSALNVFTSGGVFDALNAGAFSIALLVLMLPSISDGDALTTRPHGTNGRAPGRIAGDNVEPLTASL